MISNKEQNIRVEDYLNDKLQTSADFENLDTLLEIVKNQQTILKEQLLEAQSNLEEASKASKAHAANLQQQVGNFNKQQSDIDRRLLIVTRSETSDDAVRKIDASMEKLKRLDIATDYVDLLLKVDRLSVETRRNFRVSPQGALQPYIQLQHLATAIRRAQPAAEDAAPHLIDHVEKTATTLWKQMKGAFASEFEETLIKIKWPNKDVNLAGKLKEEWNTGVKRLLELQEPELKARDDKDAGYAGVEESLVLLPLEVMVKPLELRFRYHFDGERPTNRPDKPEYFLSHVINLLNTYNEFFNMYLQPILCSHFKGSNLALNPIYIDSTAALITALLPMTRNKVFALLPQLIKQPQLLSHLIHELMSFDTSLKDEWDYDGGCGVDAWKGLTWEVLVKKDWFSQWLQVERTFALSRYENIIESSESFEIDYDSVDPGMTKPTKAAMRVNDLLETVTDRYRPLVSFKQKLHFLIDIQIAIFDEFHNRLNSSLERYLTVASSVARTIQGVTKEEQAQIEGLSGLERLCRVYGSAEYLEKKMRDWSDDVFFLELWDELQFRARQNGGSGKNLAGDKTVEDVAGRTSSAVGSEEDTGALFDETAGAYRRLRIRGEGIIQDKLIHEIRDSLRSYYRINPWSSLSSESSNSSSLAITSELDSTVQLLSTYLSFLSKVLSTAPLRRVVRQLALSMQTSLWDNVLMKHNFSAFGVEQLTRDLSAIWETMDHYLGQDQGILGMKKLHEASVLLRLPMNSYAEDAEGSSENDHARLRIREVEKRLFRDNESAREVLEELGLDVLTESEARNVLEKRIELGN